MKCLLVGLLLLALPPVPGPQQAVAKPGQTPSGGTASPRNQQRPLKSPGVRAERGRALTGRVIGDGGQPIAEASVIAVPAGANSSGSLAALKLRTVLTDETGKFVIEDVRSGAYTLTAFVPGFVTSAGTTGQPTYYRAGGSATINLVKGGVITGTVTTPNGDPVVGTRVRAMLVREANGRPARARSFNVLQFLQDWKTDDRGVYRIFGLEAGSYVVSAGGRGLMNFTSEGYDNDAPTFHPSATRDTAIEVKVQAGDETSGVDIQYRAGRGHAISGVISGTIKAGPLNSALAVILTHAGTGAISSFSFAPFTESARSFQFDGVPDGSYDLAAIGGFGSEDVMASRPRRVDVKGQDVTGVELAIAPLGSIGGRLVLEKAPGADPKACQTGSKALVGDSVIRVRPDDGGKRQTGLSGLSMAFVLSATTPSLDGMLDEKGEFKILPLEAGRYRVEADLPAEDWFVRAITLPAQTAQSVDAARGGIPLKPGERISGVTVAVSEGAAGISGRVLPARQGASLPSRLRLHIIPAEKEAAHDVLRFFEAAVDKDGTFSISHIAPGRYLVLARESTDDESSDATPGPVSWSPDSRTKLRRQAEASNVVIEFLRCQRIRDYVMRY